VNPLEFSLDLTETQPSTIDQWFDSLPWVPRVTTPPANYATLSHHLTSKALPRGQCGPLQEPSLLNTWLATFKPWGKMAFVRIAIAIAHAGLKTIQLSETEKVEILPGVFAAEDWALSPTEQNRLNAARLLHDCNTYLLWESNVCGNLDLRELTIAAAWTAGASIDFPPASAWENLQEWEDFADDCAYEGAYYALLLYVENSSTDESDLLAHMKQIVSSELLPWCTGKGDPIAERKLNREC